MKKSITYLATLFLCVTVFLLSLAHFISVRQFLCAEQEHDALISKVIYNAVMAKFSQSLSAVQMLANDTFLIEALKTESGKTEAEAVAQMQHYLARLQESSPFMLTCVISHATYRYYRNDGLLKTINPERDAGDVWYKRFIAGDRQMLVTVYRDPDDTAHSAVYLNQPIKDSNGLFLGVASIGIAVDDFVALFSEYEQAYNVEISMVDQTGLVMLDTTYNEIYVASLAYLLPKTNFSAETWHNFPYGVGGFAATKWIPELYWHFVVRCNRVLPHVLLQSWFYLFALVILIVAISLLFSFRTRFHQTKTNYSGKLSHVDALTGLPNRNFFKDMYGERGVFNTTRYHSLAVFDIDFFKEANDSMNGDEALVSVVGHATKLLENRGMVLRWGGDEFLVLFELPIDAAYKLCRQFCKDVAQDRLVTVSVGLTEVRLADTIKKNYYRAAQNCYQVKEMGGNGVIKG